MKLTTDIEDEIDAIRDALYEEIKDMSPEEELAHFMQKAEEQRRKYNFRFALSAAGVARTPESVP